MKFLQDLVPGIPNKKWVHSIIVGKEWISRDMFSRILRHRHRQWKLIAPSNPPKT